MVPLWFRHPRQRPCGPDDPWARVHRDRRGRGAGRAGLAGEAGRQRAGVSCGECRWCRRGRTNLCATYYTLGLSTHGGLARYVAAPASILREIPDGCTDADAALAQPLAVGLHALAGSGVAPGDTVVLLGAGAIGSFLLGWTGRSRRADRCHGTSTRNASVRRPNSGRPRPT